MKLQFYTLVAMFVLLQPIQKLTMATTQKSSVAGTWELRERRGGNILPATFPAGTGNRLVLTASTYKLYEEGQLLLEGHYQIRLDHRCEYITFNHGASYSDELTLRNDTLILKPTHPDLATRIYVRVP